MITELYNNLNPAAFYPRMVMLQVSAIQQSCKLRTYNNITCTHNAPTLHPQSDYIETLPTTACRTKFSGTVIFCKRFNNEKSPSILRSKGLKMSAEQFRVVSRPPGTLIFNFCKGSKKPPSCTIVSQFFNNYKYIFECVYLSQKTSFLMLNGISTVASFFFILIKQKRHEASHEHNPKNYFYCA